MMTTDAVLAHISREDDVRNYLRGVEAGSETDKDAQRSMLAAIEYMRGSGVYDAMAMACPYLYGQACLILCRMWTDCEDSEAPKLERQYNAIILSLRYDEKNVKEVNENG